MIQFAVKLFGNVHLLTIIEDYSLLKLIRLCCI